MGDPTKRRLHGVFIRMLTGLLTLSLLIGAAPAWGQEDTAAVIQAIRSQYTVLTIDGREVVELGLQELLEIALERSTTLKAIRLGEAIASARLSAVTESSFAPTLTNSLALTRSVSASSGRVTPFSVAIRSMEQSRAWAYWT